MVSTAIPIFPIVEPMQVTNILPLGIVRVFLNPNKDNLVLVSVIFLFIPKSAGEAHKYEALL